MFFRHHEHITTTSLQSANLSHFMDLSHDDFPHLNPLWSELLHRFQGDFDNYNQVVNDRQQNKLPREGGGHEHIHCTLIPVTDNTRLAAFYFDGTPQAIFRFRFYQLVPASLVHGNTDETTIYTILYTLNPDLERQLRAVSQEPLKWPSIYRSFNQSMSNNVPSSSEDTESNPMSSVLNLLPNCEVQWSFDCDEIQHAYAAKEPSDAVHAVMVHGQALVESQMSPGEMILIKDQLSLWHHALWIHDRGFNPETMDFIYGNREDIPYKMERVAVFGRATNQGEINAATLTLSRDIAQDDLQWTLGPSFRTQEEYQVKMDAIGGPSVAPRPAKP
jgi:hypothetical protein